jgi:hypothetical protein
MSSSGVTSQGGRAAITVNVRQRTDRFQRARDSGTIHEVAMNHRILTAVAGTPVGGAPVAGEEHGETAAPPTPDLENYRLSSTPAAAGLAA